MVSSLPVGCLPSAPPSDVLLVACFYYVCVARSPVGRALENGTPRSVAPRICPCSCLWAACGAAPCAALPVRNPQVHAPLIPGVDFRFPYDAGRTAVVESVAPLGSAYQEALRKGLYEQRWVDVFPNQGKRAGAYSGGSHETLPFIFLNYEDSLAGVTTLAHEAGHSGHSALARATQPASSSGYSTFIAGTSAACGKPARCHDASPRLSTYRLSFFLCVWLIYPVVQGLFFLWCG